MRLLYVYTFGLLLFIGICAGVSSCGESATVAKEQLPDTLKLTEPEHFIKGVTEYVYQDCEYIMVNAGNASWGGHKGNCRNHSVSMNPAYESKYRIYAVQVDNSEDCLKKDYVWEIYTIFYTCEGDTAKFRGNAADIMSFGFDLNEVVKYSSIR